MFATVQVPSVLPRVVRIPSVKEGDTSVILLEEIIEKNIDNYLHILKIITIFAAEKSTKYN